MQNTSFRRSFHALILGIILAIASEQLGRAEVRLPKIFSSHMVLQREQPLLIWGWANPGETVTVALGKESHQTKANDRGEWKITLPAQKAGGPLTLKVSGSSEVILDDVLIGDVWLCSGQSNMEMGVDMCRDGKAEIAAANFPSIRLFMVANRWSPEPQSDLEADKAGASRIENRWRVCAPQTIGEGGWGGFS